MSYDLRIERPFDATPAEVYDAFVDGDAMLERVVTQRRAS